MDSPHPRRSSSMTISPSSSFQMSHPVPVMVHALTAFSCIHSSILIDPFDGRMWGVWKRAPFTSFMKLLQTDRMELQVTLEISITAVFTAPTRFALLKSWWDAISMVHFLFFFLIVVTVSFQSLWTICMSMSNRCFTFTASSKNTMDLWCLTKSTLHPQSNKWMQRQKQNICWSWIHRQRTSRRCFTINKLTQL